MARIPDEYNYSHMVGDPANGSEKEFDAARFDALLTDEDRKLLQSDFRISWWVYSDLSMRPSPHA